jgi:lipopolysaccharide/colanic/teichoic acid biosynthesis glycosyltransferase
MVDLDLEYIDKCSIFMDVKLLLETVPVVLARQGGG